MLARILLFLSVFIALFSVSIPIYMNFEKIEHIKECFSTIVKIQVRMNLFYGENHKLDIIKIYPDELVFINKIEIDQDRVFFSLNDRQFKNKKIGFIFKYENSQASWKCSKFLSTIQKNLLPSVCS